MAIIIHAIRTKIRSWRDGLQAETPNSINEPPFNPTYGSAETNKPMIDIPASLQVLQSDVTFVIHATRKKVGRSRDGLQAESWEAEQRGEEMTYSDGFTSSALVVHDAQCRSDPEGCEEEESHGGTSDKLHSSEKLRNNVIAELALSQRKIQLLSVSFSLSLVSRTSVTSAACANDYVWMKPGQRMKGWMN
jgi:hypothetical protein